MEQVRVRLQPLTIGRLERSQFLGLALAFIDREIFVDEEIPNLLAALPGVERFVLGVADAAELRIGLRRLGPVAIADNLEDPFALIDLLPEHRAQIACFRAENVLPDRLVTEIGERVGGELAAAPQLLADGGNENERERSHGRSYQFSSVLARLSPAGAGCGMRVFACHPKVHRVKTRAR
jgi:hypothetical protein